ncbi:MAG: outer membrane lipoprotein-sorting protein [Candidatus Omnitrophica bacterium]|nr:outer membrane lipoprotein-sorting protein [Candidatus Omnitrophota bacterium]
MCKIFGLAGLCLFLCAGGAGNAAPLTVDEIVAKANTVAYYEGSDGRAQVAMTITDSQGRSRKRVFTILRLDMVDGGAQKYYVYFREPADVRDMSYMVWKNVDKDDDRWMYLPALDLVRRIAASDKRSSFVGSHFLYEDISGRALSLDKHELLREDDAVYVVRNTPIESMAVEFSYFDVSIRKDNFLPVKGEYYDKQGKLSRVVEAVEFKDIQGHPTVVKSKATDLAAGGATVTEFTNVEYDLGMDETVFTERYLRRPPEKWLK